MEVSSGLCFLRQLIKEMEAAPLAAHVLAVESRLR